MLVRAPSLGSPGQPSVSTVSQAVEAGLAQGAFIDAHRERFGVEPVGRVLGVSASAYYKHASGERCARAVADERLLGRIRELHAANYYTYGYRRIWKALLRAG